MLKKPLLCLVGLLALALVVPLGYAETYSGDARYSVYPELTMAVVIDTTDNLWTFVWYAPSLVLAPPCWYMWSSWGVMDGGGYRNQSKCEIAGAAFIYNYTNRGVWTRTTLHWTYFFGVGDDCFIWYNFDLWVDIYIPASTHSLPEYPHGGASHEGKCYYR